MNKNTFLLVVINFIALMYISQLNAQDLKGDELKSIDP